MTTSHVRPRRASSWPLRSPINVSTPGGTESVADLPRLKWVTFQFRRRASLVRWGPMKPVPPSISRVLELDFDAPPEGAAVGTPVGVPSAGAPVAPDANPVKAPGRTTPAAALAAIRSNSRRVFIESPSHTAVQPRTI